DPATLLDPAVLREPPAAPIVVVLTSSSAAEQFQRRGLGQTEAPSSRSTRWIGCLALGEPTRRTAESLGLHLLGTAATPDADGIATALDRALRH
ncbi:MAG: hypothetical protein Q4G34_10830, partial [Micrococcus sp.]|nr:hypothetical protein [Micrococcus sp.]